MLKYPGTFKMQSSQSEDFYAFSLVSKGEYAEWTRDRREY